MMTMVGMKISQAWPPMTGMMNTMMMAMTIMQPEMGTLRLREQASLHQHLHREDLTCTWRNESTLVLLRANRELLDASFKLHTVLLLLYVLTAAVRSSGRFGSYAFSCDQLSGQTD